MDLPVKDLIFAQLIKVPTAVKPYLDVMLFQSVQECQKLHFSRSLIENKMYKELSGISAELQKLREFNIKLLFYKELLSKEETSVQQMVLEHLQKRIDGYNEQLE